MQDAQETQGNKIAIIVVSWNVSDQLKQCLESIDRYADVPCEVIVADNASVDESVAMLHSFSFTNNHVTNFTIFENKENIGFAKGCNQGIGVMDAEHALLLNPDARIREHTLSKSLEFIQEHSDAGVIGCKIEYEDGSKQGSAGSFPTLRGQLTRRLGWVKESKKAKIFRAAPARKWQEDVEMPVDHVKGAFFLITRRALNAIGELDGGFFLWFEETDYCLSVWQSGLKVYYTPSIAVTHVGGASFKKVSEWKKRMIWFRSIKRYFTKHYGLPTGIAIAILDPICEVVGSVYRKIKYRKKSIQ